MKWENKPVDTNKLVDKHYKDANHLAVAQIITNGARFMVHGYVIRELTLVRDFYYETNNQELAHIFLEDGVSQLERVIDNQE